MTKAGAYDIFSVTMVMAVIGSMNTKQATATAYSLNKNKQKKTVVHFLQKKILQNKDYKVLPAWLPGNT